MGSRVDKNERLQEMQRDVADLARATDKGIDLNAYRQGGLDYSDAESVAEEELFGGDAKRDSLEVMIGSHFDDAQNEEWTYKLMGQVISSPTIASIH